jgi:hypothetical protein
MKNVILFMFLLFSAITSKAQFDYDSIDRNEFSLLKANSNLKSGSMVRVSSIKGRNVVEQVFGANYESRIRFGETEKVNYEDLVFCDGLTLSAVENSKYYADFHVTSKDYILLLKNGATIQIGMKASDFQTLFSKSYSKRLIINNVKGKQGKLEISVFFSYIYDNKIQIADTRIIFIFSKENGILEEFYTYNPS